MTLATGFENLEAKLNALIVIFLAIFVLNILCLVRFLAASRRSIIVSIIKDSFIWFEIILSQCLNEN